MPNFLFINKTTIFPGLLKRFPSYRRSLQHSKENIQHIPDAGSWIQGVKKAPDPGSGYAKLNFRNNKNRLIATDLRRRYPDVKHVLKM